MTSSCSNIFKAHKSVIKAILKSCDIENISSKKKKKLLNLLNSNTLCGGRGGDYNKISDLKNADEYYDFVKSLQARNDFPKMFHSEDIFPVFIDEHNLPYITVNKNGKVYIVSKLSSNNERRKMTLSIALLKEKNAYNLSCWMFDDSNNFKRALDANGDYYNILNNEMCIVGTSGLLRERMNTPQGSTRIWLTAFPFNIEVARLILGNKTWNPSVKFYESDFSLVYVTSNDPKLARLAIDMKNLKVNNGTTQLGLGTGVGLTKNKLILETNYPADEMKPEINYAILDVEPISKDFFGTFQVSYVGTDKNLVLICGGGSAGNLMMDDNVKILFDPNPSF
jgi:hypothetical protein